MLEKYTPPAVAGNIVEEPLSQADYEAIKDNLRTYRDILLCQTLRGTGLRISEVLALTPQYLGEDGPRAFVLIRRSKKRKEVWERVFLAPRLAVELRDYIKGTGIAPGAPIFNIGRRQVVNIFHDAGLKAIGRRVHPHEFRGLYIKWLLDNGLSIEAAAKMVGHEDPKTTARWYYELTREQRSAIQERIPV